MIKSTLLILAFGLSQMLLAQDKFVKKFVKNYKSEKGANYLVAANGSDFELGNDELDGVFSLIGKTKDVSILNIDKTSGLETSFTNLNNNLSKKYDTLLKTNSDGNFTALYSDERNKYYYFLTSSEKSITLFMLQIK